MSLCFAIDKLCFHFMNWLLVDSHSIAYSGLMSVLTNCPGRETFRGFSRHFHDAAAVGTVLIPHGHAVELSQAADELMQRKQLRKSVFL